MYRQTDPLAHSPAQIHRPACLDRRNEAWIDAPAEEVGHVPRAAPANLTENVISVSGQTCCDETVAKSTLGMRSTTQPSGLSSGAPLPLLQHGMWKSTGNRLGIDQGLTQRLNRLVVAEHGAVNCLGARHGCGGERSKSKPKRETHDTQSGWLASGCPLPETPPPLRAPRSVARIAPCGAAPDRRA